MQFSDTRPRALLPGLQHQGRAGGRQGEEWQVQVQVPTSNGF